MLVQQKDLIIASISKVSTKTFFLQLFKSYQLPDISPLKLMQSAHLFEVFNKNLIIGIAHFHTPKSQQLTMTKRVCKFR